MNARQRRSVSLEYRMDDISTDLSPQSLKPSSLGQGLLEQEEGPLVISSWGGYEWGCPGGGDGLADPDVEITS